MVFTRRFGGGPGVRSVVIETERAGHARELVESLSVAELDSYDGIVAVRDPRGACFLWAGGCGLGPEKQALA